MVKGVGSMVDFHTIEIERWEPQFIFGAWVEFCAKVGLPKTFRSDLYHDAMVLREWDSKGRLAIGEIRFAVGEYGTLAGDLVRHHHSADALHVVTFKRKEG